MIISDRDPRFTSKFWTSLLDLLGTDFRFSIAFHPQTDSQSERMIQTLENFWRPYVERNPLEWTQHLALAEFVPNNAVSTAIGYSPFYLNGNERPIIPSTFLGMFGTSQVVVVQEMVDWMKAALESVKLNLIAAQIRMKEYADRSWWSETFFRGTKVLLSTRNLRVDLHLPSKLRRWWIGLYKVTDFISLVAYRLDLPPAWRILPSSISVT